MNPAEKMDHIYTVKEYLAWPDDERWELINGLAYCMSPAPSIRHQQVVLAFGRIVKNRLTNNSCMVGVAPIDVVLSEHDVVQPDVIVVCDRKKITEANIQGAPDLVVEVLSPATAIRDKKDKKALYEKHGVREYIIIDPTGRYVERFVLIDGVYGLPDILGTEETLILHSLNGMEIQLNDVFELEAQTS